MKPRLFRWLTTPVEINRAGEIGRLLAFVGLCLAVTFAFWIVRQDDIEDCEQRNEDRAALVALVEVALDRLVIGPDGVETFLLEARTRLAPLDCEGSIL